MPFVSPPFSCPSMTCSLSEIYAKDHQTKNRQSKVRDKTESIWNPDREIFLHNQANNSYRIVNKLTCNRVLNRLFLSHRKYTVTPNAT